jgi:hypothetical protein
MLVIASVPWMSGHGLAMKHTPTQGMKHTPVASGPLVPQQQVKHKLMALGVVSCASMANPGCDGRGDVRRATIRETWLRAAHDDSIVIRFILRCGGLQGTTWAPDAISNDVLCARDGDGRHIPSTEGRRLGPVLALEYCTQLPNSNRREPACLARFYTPQPDAPWNHISYVAFGFCRAATRHSCISNSEVHRQG